MKDKVVRYGNRSKFKFLSSKFLSFLGLFSLSIILLIPALIVIAK